MSSNRYLKNENRAFKELRLNLDLTSKLLQNHFRDSETESHPPTDNVLSPWNLPEKFEQFAQIFLLNAYACILDTWDKHIVHKVQG